MDHGMNNEITDTIRDVNQKIDTISKLSELEARGEKLRWRILYWKEPLGKMAYSLYPNMEPGQLFGPDDEAFAVVMTLDLVEDLIAAEERRQRCRGCTGTGTVIEEKTGNYHGPKRVECPYCKGTGKRI